MLETSFLGSSSTKNLRVVPSNLHNLKNKEDEISVLLQNEFPDIVAFTEAWLPNDILDGEVTFDDYQMFRQDRSSKRGWGVLMLTMSEPCTYQLSC